MLVGIYPDVRQVFLYSNYYKASKTRIIPMPTSQSDSWRVVNDLSIGSKLGMYRSKLNCRLWTLASARDMTAGLRSV